MTAHIIKTLAFTALSLSLLTGCAQVKDELGLERHSPDEFSVVKRAPLSLPPEYSLRPPREGTSKASNTTQKAKTTVFGSPEQQTNDVPTTSEQNLLNKIGVSNSDPEIRKILDRDSGSVTVKDKTVAEKILFWQDKPDANNVINPQDEKKRLETQDHSH